ncbi:MAG: hypothetical protein K8R90_02420 [Candidatus Cloacimonetes bacterium]|nr:hypothetical protein [Candidatus Cloacimonadota bacterium]
MRRWLPLLAAVLALVACDTVKDTAYDAPSNLVITKVDDGRLRIAWNYDANFQDVVYHIARKDGEASWDESHAATTDDSQEFIDEVNTDSYTVYGYKVRANYIEDNAISTYSLPVAWFSPQAAPTDLLLEQVAENTVTLTWVDNAIGEEGYKVDKKVDTGGWSINYKKLDANTTTWQDSVVFGASVSYRVYAYLGESNSNSVQDNVTSSFPAPTGIDAQQTSQQQIRVCWDNNSDMQDGYVIERRIGVTDFSELAQATDTLYVDYLGITAGTVAYRVRAFAQAPEGGETLYSAYSVIDTVQFNITTRGALCLPDAGVDVYVDGGNCYVANEYSGLQMIDSSNENAPVVDYTMILGGRTKAVSADESLVFVTNQSGGLHLIDISEYLMPMSVGYCETIAVPYDVVVDLYGNYPYAWVADGQTGVLTIALGNDNPANPRVVHRLNTYGVSYALVRNGDILYIADGSEGVKMVDISDPTAPVVTQQSAFVGEARGLALDGNRLFVAAGENGLVALDANTLSTLYTVQTRGFANDVAVSGAYVLLADRDNGLVLVDTVSDTGPIVAAEVSMSGACHSLTIQNNYAYLTTDNQLLIVQIGP